MAKIKKFKLSWKHSKSDLIAGYKLYWSIKSPVHYSSNSIKLDKINELDMPDILIGIALSGESIYLGISAIDEMGNESDITTLSEPFNFSVPSAPEEFALIGQDDFKIIDPYEEDEHDEPDENPIPSAPNQDIAQDNESIEPPGPPAPLKLAAPEGRNDDDFGIKIKKIFQKNS